MVKNHVSNNSFCDKTCEALRLHPDYMRPGYCQFDKIVLEPDHTFTVLEVEPLHEKPGSVSIDDVESKIRFDRYIEKKAGITIFHHPAPEPINR